MLLCKFVWIVVVFIFKGIENFWIFGLYLGMLIVVVLEGIIGFWKVLIKKWENLFIVSEKELNN